MRFVKPALNCNQTADIILGTDTGTTVDTTLQTLGGETGRAPLWWALIHIVTKSITAASIASIPCSYDLSSVSNNLANDKIDSPSLRREIQDFINDCYMPFLRAGYAKDGGSLLEVSVSAGVACQPKEDDLFGIAANWGRPNESSFGPGLDDQYGLEVFYRAQVTDNLRVTPSIQLLANPALNPTEDLMAVFGMRGVLSF